jgi:peptide/nickel transport system substrate-binding protein
MMSGIHDPRLQSLLLRVGARHISRRTALKGVVASGLVAGVTGGLAASGVEVRSAWAQTDGTLTIGRAQEPKTLDPQYADGVDEYTVLVNIMDGLFTTGENVKVVPRLVDTWKQVDDLTWEFVLKPDIVFHNGEPLTSEAVKASYERSIDPDIGVLNSWGGDVNLESVEVVDDLTFRFHTSEPTPQMLARLANDHFIFPPKYLAETDPTTLARNPIGTGAYVFQEWSPGERITMTANPDFWGEPKPTIETLDWRFIPEESSRVASLETGAIDLADGLLPTTIAEIETHDDLTALSVQGTRRVYIGLNTKLKPTDDLRVRQAINYGADIETICETILGGATTRMKNWAEPAFQNPDVEGYHYDPELAKQLLTDAGYPDGVTVTMDYAKTGSVGIDEFPQAIAISLRDVGIEVELNLMENNILTDNIEKASLGDVDAVGNMYLRSNASYFDPGLTYSYWRPGDDDNGTGYDNPEFADLLNKILTGGTPEERLAWAYKAQQIMTDDAPALFLWYEPKIYGLNKRVQGFSPTGDEHLRFAGVSLAEE